MAIVEISIVPLGTGSPGGTIAQKIKSVEDKLN